MPISPKYVEKIQRSKVKILTRVINEENIKHSYESLKERLEEMTEDMHVVNMVLVHFFPEPEEKQSKKSKRKEKKVSGDPGNPSREESLDAIRENDYTYYQPANDNSDADSSTDASAERTDSESE